METYKTKDFDFIVIENSIIDKSFYPINPDGTPYSMSGSSVSMKIYTDPVTSMGLTLNGTDDTVGTVRLDSSITSTLQTLEYSIVETKTNGEIITLFQGTISIQSESQFTTSVNSLIEGLKPDGINLDPNFKNQQITYWRLYLQPLTTPPIDDENLNSDENWPPLVNFLIAYLVIYDFLKKYARKAFSDMFGNGAADTEGAQIKKIETGPTNVEYFDSASALQNVFKTNTQGMSPFDKLAEEACMLSKRLRIYLPICGHLSHNPVIPHKVGRPPIKDAITILNKYYG
jgi:hypothetical protein